MTWRHIIGVLMQLLLVSARPNWSWGIREGLTLLFAIALFLIELVVLAVLLYLAGLIVVGKKRALFSDALIIALLGTVLSTLFVIFLPNLIAFLLIVVTWLILIKRLFETGWLGAIAVGILIIIIYLAILVLLALVLGFLGLIVKWLTTMPL
ncbi:MAG: hypothetical protein NZ932_03725 [Candidatus Bathyarchaeota archaeon]|nr:hypothetical protein [Candidatus Bathyarchaeota archaeon]MDW8040745.1 hypothetical protein [Nitrososphaerota archaeon]